MTTMHVARARLAHATRRSSLLALFLPIAACAGGASPAPAPFGVVSGQVRSLAGAPVAGARVRAGSGPEARTDAQGNFAIRGVRPGERTPLWVSSDSFVTTASVHPVRAGYETVAYVDLIPRAPATRLDAERGGRAALGRGGWVGLEPGSLVDAAGRPARGEVLVTATYIDPADVRQVRAAPGDYVGVDSAGGAQRLRTYGMAEVRFTDDAGAELRLAPGRTAALSWPPLEGRRGAMYRLGDDARWQWTGPGTGPAAIQNAGTWNFDQNWAFACLWVTLQPRIEGIQVTATGTGWWYSGVTDANGSVMLAVKPGDQVTLSNGGNANTEVVQSPASAAFPLEHEPEDVAGACQAQAAAIDSVSVSLVLSTGHLSNPLRTAGLYPLHAAGRVTVERWKVPQAH